jgi:CheY-like chemotaxis protein
MKRSVVREFRGSRPRAIVLDDHNGARKMTTRRLRSFGFEVVPCRSVDEFRAAWSPGLFDVIVADWELSATDYGDQVLADVRDRDWDVPFVLVSGKLQDKGDRVEVLEHLLASGGARFIVRGDASIETACREAEALIERRDLALLKVILALRPAALAGEAVQTPSGPHPVAKLLEQVVARPTRSHRVERSIAENWFARATRRRTAK